jgi:hypothetical protein
MTGTNLIRRAWPACATALLAIVALAAVGEPGGPVVAHPAPPPRGGPAAVTFTRDVAPILQQKCQVCHRPGSIAPMSLLTYEDARTYAPLIKARVAARTMPPWHIDRTVGVQKFKNDRSLTDQELDIVLRWVNAGAPKGDARDMPPPVQWPSEEKWNFAELFGGPPDLILKSPAYTQRSTAQDAWYKPVVSTGLTEPRWVRAIEIRPGTPKGRKVTHHALARLIQDEKSDEFKALADEDAIPGLFMEWAVGKQGEIMRPNSGKLMLPGSKIVFDIHYSAANEDVTDQVELGIYLYPKGQEPKFRQTLHLLSGITAGNRNLDIAPNSIYVGTNFHVMRRAGRVVNFQRLMYILG